MKIRFFLDGSFAYRGCMSDVDSEGVGYCKHHDHHCEKCPKRACNTNLMKFDKKISCFKCNPTENDDCDKIAENSTATECAGTALGYKNECYIYQKDKRTFRGCLYDAKSESEEIFRECRNQYSANCYTCDQDSCNNNSVLYDDLDVNFLKLENEENLNTKSRLCYECDSRNNDTKCARDLDESMITKCPNSEDDLGCFHKTIGTILRPFFSNQSFKINCCDFLW